MRMARVNITVPDVLLKEARSKGLNISRLASRAVADDLHRLAKIAALDDYLTELDAELGPVEDAERAEAEAWADRVLGPRDGERSA